MQHGIGCALAREKRERLGIGIRSSHAAPNANSEKKRAVKIQYNNSRIICAESLWQKYCADHKSGQYPNSQLAAAAASPEIYIRCV